jgi:hypothetical protein
MLTALMDNKYRSFPSLRLNLRRRAPDFAKFLCRIGGEHFFFKTNFDGVGANPFLGFFRRRFGIRARSFSKVAETEREKKRENDFDDD